MPMNCKGLCQTYPQIFINNNRPTFKIGENVYFCKLCEKYVEIKQIIKNALFKIKNKCVCCKARFRVKQSRSGRQNRKYCKCGCGEKINKLDGNSNPIFYKLNHNKRIKNIEDRICIKCHKKQIRNECPNKKVRWKPLSRDNNKTVYLCNNCVCKNRHHIKKLKKILNELHYCAVMKMT